MNEFSFKSSILLNSPISSHIFHSRCVEGDMENRSFSSCGSRSRSTWGGKAQTRENKWGQQEESEGQGWNAKGSPWGAKSNGLTVHTEQNQDYRSTGGEKSSWGASSKWDKVSPLSPICEKRDLFNSPKKIKSTRWGCGKFDNDDSSQNVKGWGRDQDGGGWGRGRGRECFGGRGRGGRGRSRECFGGRGRGGIGRGRECFGGRANGDWKNNRSPRPAYDPSKPSILTMTGQRLDMFSAELQDVLMETESIMKNIRRIMSLREYSDGDPLPEEDQKYIIENVFNYHPNKAVKTGAGIDYITVDKPEEFQESRCFHAVTIDGNKVDFSYFKCLENYLKQKYPEKAEEFLSMYFKRRQPRGVLNKEQNPWTQRMSPHAGWCKDQRSETPRMSSPVGWNKEQWPGTQRMSSQ